MEIVERFTVTAEQFCHVVDAESSLGREEFFIRIYAILPKLIDQAICMPDIQLDDSDVKTPSRTGKREDTRVAHDQWERLYGMLGEKLGDWNLYRQLFDPVTDTEPVCGSLADDLADIYRDLKEGLLTSESKSGYPEHKIWKWRLSFYFHWGKHAIQALNVIHSRLHYS